MSFGTNLEQAINTQSIAILARFVINCVKYIICVFLNVHVHCSKYYNTSIKIIQNVNLVNLTSITKFFNIKN